MDKNIEIELFDEDCDNAQDVTLPCEFSLVGKISEDDVKVYISRDVYDELEKLAVSDTGREIGSILIGDYRKDGAELHVVISHYIEAKYSSATSSSLTFTHKTWEYVHSEHSRLYPDKKIVGWQHTHPSFGIFLSRYDMFIQENFFGFPFAVAYVIDPIRNTRGFFQWKNGAVEELGGYCLYEKENGKC